MFGVEKQNIEVKVRLNATEHLRLKANAAGLVSDTGNLTKDVDTYFRVAQGRLKLRVSDDERAGTLIYYERSNEAASRLSQYQLVPVADACALRDTLATALGVLVTVRKHRNVLIFGQTRIHFDHVEDLGWFVELETVIGVQGHQAALDEHHSVYQKLGLETGEIVPESYSDLLLQRGRSA